VFEFGMVGFVLVGPRAVVIVDMLEMHPPSEELRERPVEGGIASGPDVTVRQGDPDGTVR
jgi:hypothetical protein